MKLLAFFLFLFYIIICNLTNFAFGLSTQFCNGTFSDDEAIDTAYFRNVDNALLFLHGKSAPSDERSPRNYREKSMGDSPNRAHGSYLCRGDLSAKDCYNCLGNLVSDLGRDNKIKGYDCFVYDNVNLECVLHYANSSRYMNYRKDGIITNKEFGDDLSKHPRYKNALSLTLHEVAREFANDQNWSEAKFLAKVVDVPESNEQLYILFQCTPDISQTRCITCLSDLHETFPPKTVGGHVLAANCLLKYDNQPFFSITVTTKTTSEHELGKGGTETAETETETETETEHELSKGGTTTTKTDRDLSNGVCYLMPSYLHVMLVMLLAM